MQIITNLKRKSTKETQVNLKVICPRCASFETRVKFDNSVAMPTLLSESEQDSKGCTPHASTLELPMGEGVPHTAVH